MFNLKYFAIQKELPKRKIKILSKKVATVFISQKKSKAKNSNTSKETTSL